MDQPIYCGLNAFIFYLFQIKQSLLQKSLPLVLLSQYFFGKEEENNYQKSHKWTKCGLFVKIQTKI